MTTTTTRKTSSSTTPPPSLADVARKKLRAHLQAYRSLLKRQADGESLTEDELSRVVDALEACGLPEYCWPRDLEALQRHAVVQEKFRAALKAEAPGRERSAELMKEIDTLRARLATLQEEQRKAQAAIHKPATYGNTLAQLEAEHPHALGDIDTAVTLRLDELNRRRQEGVS